MGSGRIDELLTLMAQLRDPQTGCAWDIRQTFETIAPYTTEEAAEVVDAIVRGDMEDLREELGDLLLQVVFHARIAEEAGHFAFADVVEAISAKLVRRHPHVFGDAHDLSPDEVRAVWDGVKAQEKAARAARLGDAAEASVLAGVPAVLPALQRAVALQDRAGKVGFDWRDAGLVIAKIREELDEVEAAIAAEDADDQAAEIGDVLFAMANLARHLGADPDLALRRTNAKFERRFGYVEGALAAKGSSPAASTLAEMDALWNEAKAAEKASTES